MLEFDFDWLFEEKVTLLYSVLRFDFDWQGMDYSTHHDGIRRKNKYTAMI